MALLKSPRGWPQQRRLLQLSTAGSRPIKSRNLGETPFSVAINDANQVAARRNHLGGYDHATREPTLRMS